METVFDLREAMAFVVGVLGVSLVAYGIWVRRKRKSPMARLLFALSFLILVSAVYVIENDVLDLLGISRADEIAQNVTDAFWWLALGIFVTQSLDIVLWRGILTHKGELLVPRVLVHLSNFFIYLVFFILFLHFSVGKDVTALIATSGFLVVGLGYLAKGPFESAFAGLALNLVPMFKKGDSVEIGDSVGTVVDIGWLHVTLKAKEGHYIHIQNLLVEHRVVINFSQPTQKPCYTTEVRLEYEVPLERGLDLIRAALADLSETIQISSVCAMHFSRFGITYQIRFFIADKHAYIEVVNAIHSAVYYKLQREHSYDFGYDKFGSMNAASVGDKLLTTHRAVSETVTLSAEQRINLLGKVEIFESLKDEEIAELAKTCVPRIFGPPEKIIKQGDAGDSMFVIVQGRVQVFIKPPNHEIVELATSGPGQYFGEMALLTGQPRGATVRAIDEVMVLEIPKGGLRPILQMRFELAGAIADSVAKRQMANVATISAADSKDQDVPPTRNKIAEAIRMSVLHFFGLHEHHKE